MTKRIFTILVFFVSVSSAFIAGILIAQDSNKSIQSAVIQMNKAIYENNDWGTFYTYFSGETYGTKDVLTGVAVVKSGMQIHPPHIHAEEEYLMVSEGKGTWHLNGEEFPAQKGDFLYAAPWDIHGITNTADTPLNFVVWKWNNKGMDLPLKRE